MHTLARIEFSFVLLSVLCVVGSRAAAQTPRPSPAAANGAITGRVMIGGRAAPAGIVVVAASGNDRFAAARGSAAARARTDAEGRYRLTNLPAGNFHVTPLAPAHAPAEMTEDGFAGRLVTLGEGETVNDVDFALARGGVITGRVTDGGDNRPLVEARVELTNLDNARDNGGMRMMMNPFMFRTNDLGVYRIYGLRPGRYRVSVGGNLGGFGTTSPIARTFAPSTTAEAEATVITLEEGEEETNVDIIARRRERAFTASGRIVDADTNQPVPNTLYGHGTVSDDSGRLTGADIGGNRSSARGEFRIESLAPGRYAAFAFFARMTPGDPATNEYYGEPAAFEITDADVTNLEIKLRRGATVTGVVHLEGATAQTSARLARAQIYASPTQPDSLQVPRFAPAQVGLDGSFRVTGLPPGRLMLSITDPRERGSLRLLRVERDGNLQPDGIEVAAGEQVTGVRLVVVTGAGAVRGQVRVTNGALPAGARIFINGRRTGDSPLRIGAQADERGRFLIENVPAGDYEFSVAFYGARAGEGNQPTNRRFTVSETFTVRDDGETTVTLNLDLSQPNSEPNP